MKKLILFMVIFIALITPAFADGTYRWVCLERGDVLPKYDFTCRSWCCYFCVNEEGTVNPNGCGTAQPCSCSGTSTYDFEPPEMVLVSPEEGAYYPSRTISVEANFPEEHAQLYAKNNNRVGAKYTRLCALAGSCTRTMTVDEGQNSWTFMATDYYGNPTYEVREFTVDARPPIISRTWPRAGEYASKTFGVSYTEDALLGATLYYSDNSLHGYTAVPGDCESGRNQVCEITVPGELAQGPLEYYFCISDYAAQVCSSPVSVIIDTLSPELQVLSPEAPSHLGEPIVYNTRSVPFHITTDEPVTLSYIDFEDRLPRERMLCSNCMGTERPQGFSDGPHELLIMAVDRAGNPSEEERSFIVDSMPPRIMQTLPRANTYGNGLFEVQYNELNPVRVSVFYRQEGEQGYQRQDSFACEGGQRQTCEIYVEGLPEGRLEYYFEVEDIAGELAQSRGVSFNVDTVAPVMGVHKPDQELYSTRLVPFDIIVQDAFPVTLSYIDAQDARPREVTLARNVYDFQTSRPFSDGLHELTIYARDPAGNEAEHEWAFRVDSMPPRILRSEPRNRAYGNEHFTAFYTELNPATLSLWYKEEGQAEFKVKEKHDCTGGTSESCTITVPGIQNGQVEYYFALTDIVGGESVQRMPQVVTIDTVAPGLTVVSPESTPYNSRLVRFTVHSTEEATLEYIDHASPFPIWRRLATRVTDYSRDLGFSYGPHEVQIRLTDQAGNEAVSAPIAFEVQTPYS
jgi:hypothetical protein